MYFLSLSLTKHYIRVQNSLVFITRIRITNLIRNERKSDKKVKEEQLGVQ